MKMTREQHAADLKRKWKKFLKTQNFEVELWDELYSVVMRERSSRRVLF